jgi:hypothetical protein
VTAPPPRPGPRGPRPGGLPDTGLSDDELPDRDLIERIWAVMSRWAVPVMMTLAYAFLAATSETNNTGRMWMGVGLLFVFAVWFSFRVMTETAGLSRALAVGDVAKLRELADHQLPRLRRPEPRARMFVARALAYQLCGQFAEALAAIEAALATERLAPELMPLAATIQIGALVELGRPKTDDWPHPIASPAAPALAWLAVAEIAWRDRRLDEAAETFARVIDDVRAGSAVRAIAHVYAARIADMRREHTAAVDHRARAAALAMPEAIWLHAGGCIGGAINA